MNQELLADESFEVEGLGTLKPLTMAQMADLRFAISRDLVGLATQTLLGNDKSVASAAIAMQVANMNMFEQAKTIVYAPMLLAQAAHMMMVDKKKSAAQVAALINNKNSDGVHRAIWSSYGFEFHASPEGEDRSDPTAAAAATAAASESTTSESAESLPPSTDGLPATSAS